MSNWLHQLWQWSGALLRRWRWRAPLDAAPAPSTPAAAPATSPATSTTSTVSAIGSYWQLESVPVRRHDTRSHCTLRLRLHYLPPAARLNAALSRVLASEVHVRPASGSAQTPPLAAGEALPSLDFLHRQ